MIKEKSFPVMGKTDSKTRDSALTNDESVWIAYKAVNPSVTAKLRAIEVANPNVGTPKSSAAKGATATTMLKIDTIVLSNLAILRALLVNSISFCSLSGWLRPKAPHHIRPFSSAKDW